MLKKFIFIVSLMFWQSLAIAGQGLFLKLNSYLPNINVKVLEKRCVNETEKIKMNQLTYIEAGCHDDSWVKIAILENQKQIAQYKISLSAQKSTLFPTGKKNIDDNVIVSTFYPHIGILNSQDRVTISIARNEERWMGELSEVIGKKSLANLIIPGSHDSATQGITLKSKITSDMDKRIKMLFDLDLGNMLMPRLVDWSVTQQFSIKDQLNLGIRYLDLRLCHLKKELVTCHGLSSYSLQKVFTEVTDFINHQGHEKELIILDINHLADLNANDIANLTKLIEDSFESKLASPLEFTYHHELVNFWKKKKQVIIFLNHAQAVNLYPDIYWRPEMINSPWPDKQDANELRISLEKILKETNLHAKLFVLQTQETPSTQTIIDSLNFLLHPDSLLKMTTLYKHEIEKWLNEPKIKSQIKAKGNIIIEDFSNGVDLTEYARVLNSE